MKKYVEEVRGCTEDQFWVMLDHYIKPRRNNNEFANKAVPYMGKKIIHEIVSQLNLRDETVAVWYNIELAYYLCYIGIDDITIMIAEEDHILKILCEKLNIKYMVVNINEEYKLNKKFDLVIGNPPYQDGTKDGGQNKIYNQISKRSLEMINTEVGILAFITPTSVLKKTKRFSVIGECGLEYVSFNTDKYLNVGVNTCYWIVNRKHSGDVIVICKDEEHIVKAGKPIYDFSKVDKEFAKLYDTLKRATNKPEKRMFSHNAVDMTIGKGRSKKQTCGFDYPVYSICSDKSITLIQYNKTKPKLHGKKQLIIPISKSFNENFAIVDSRDYDMKHLSIEVKNDIEVKNIKSFIFSKYFQSHVNKWKDIDGYGWNYALMYLPAFDKTKQWTNGEVKEFLESFLDNGE